ncbi:MAG: homocysteine S-methyltransferase family protein [Isosphaeraceae bacterium]|nr:homocysteine S-methyltransferase family protein [Isosphaeraceae bacterium]
MSDRLAHAMARGPVVLDAGFGTRLIALGLDLANDDPAFWNLSRPDAVLSLHGRDRAAGAAAVVTNTFGANLAWLTRWGRQDDVESINRRAVALAREAVGEHGLVFGSIGPTATSVAGAARAQAAILAASGVDALLFETHRLDQAEASLRAVRDLVTLPVVASLVAWPEPVADSARRLSDLGAAVLGVNCVLGMVPALAAIETLARGTNLPLFVKPAAGRPGETLDSPADFARAVPRLLDFGVRLLGGCCGTTDAHVAALYAACYD